MKTGIELISEERKEQINKHGFNSLHDTLNSCGELGQAAIYCLTGKEEDYPEGWSLEYQYKIDRANLKKRLTVAGALIAAEIDRINNIEISQIPTL